MAVTTVKELRELLATLPDDEKVTLTADTYYNRYGEYATATLETDSKVLLETE